MKKQLIAVAVASVAASSAMAQNVTMYGVLDVGAFKLSGHSLGLNNTNNLIPASQSATGLINNFARQGTSTNHIGFRANEDLGGGMYTGFDLQLTNLDMSTGSSGLAFGREAHLKFGSKSLGDFKFGRTISTMCSVGCSYDYNYIGAGSAPGLIGLSPASQRASSRRSDLIEWASLNMSGFQGRVGFQLKGDQNTDATFASSGGVAHAAGTSSTTSAGASAGASNYKTVNVVALSYQNGPFRAAAVRESTPTDSKAIRAGTWAGAEYDFKMFKANAQYVVNPNRGGATVTADGSAAVDRTGQYAFHSAAGTTYGKGYVFALIAPVATGLNVGLQYADNSEQKINATELFAQYSLSKRTTLYAVSSKLSGTTAVTSADATVSSSTIGRSAVQANPSITGVGLRHTF